MGFATSSIPPANTSVLIAYLCLQSQTAILPDGCFCVLPAVSVAVEVVNGHRVGEDHVALARKQVIEALGGAAGEAGDLPESAGQT